MRAPDVVFARQGSNCPDPILAAIRTVHIAHVAHTHALTGLDENDEVAMGRANAASDRHGAAVNALRAMHPTTWAGFCELVNHYAQEVPAYGQGEDAIDHLQRIVERIERLRSQESFALGFGSAT